MDLSQYVTVNQAAEISGFSTDWVRKLARRGDVGAVKFGFVWLICSESVESYANSERKIGRPPNEPPDVEPSLVD